MANPTEKRSSITVCGRRLEPLHPGSEELTMYIIRVSLLHPGLSFRHPRERKTPLRARANPHHIKRRSKSAIDKWTLLKESRGLDLKLYQIPGYRVSFFYGGWGRWRQGNVGRTWCLIDTKAQKLQLHGIRVKMYVIYSKWGFWTYSQQERILLKTFFLIDMCWISIEKN